MSTTIEAEQVNLAASCPCGHTANYHPSRHQQEIQLNASGGRYPGECKGGTTQQHCRCITPREQVMESSR